MEYDRPSALSTMVSNHEWNLDGLGNWSVNTTTINGATSEEERLDTTFNEYYEIDSATQTHDDNGNLTSDGSKTYKWDGFNRLREVSDGEDTIVTFVYDAQNRLVRKDRLGTVNDIDFAYVGWQVIEQYEGGGTNPKRQFVYGNYIDEVLVMDVNNDNDSTCTETEADDRYFYHQNTLFSVYGITDSDGNLIEAYDYDPYGTHTQIDNSGSPITDFTTGRTTLGASNIGNPYMFTGREFMPETGLQINGNRFYSHSLGRWVSRDPIGYSDGVNLYCYVSSAPTTYNDSSGTQAGAVGTEWRSAEDGSSRPALESVFDPDESVNFRTPPIVDNRDWRVWATMRSHANAATNHVTFGEAGLSLNAYLIGYSRGLNGKAMIKENEGACLAATALMILGIDWARDNAICGRFYNIPKGYGKDHTGSPWGPYSCDEKSDGGKWNNAVGAFFMGAFGEVKWPAGSIYIEIGDRYNFHNTGTEIKTLPIINPLARHITENELARLEILNMAHPYNRKSEVIGFEFKDIMAVKSQDVKNSICR